MLRARLTDHVRVPHLTGSILDTDEAILAAYKRHPFPPPPEQALREARAGGVHGVWCIWDGDRYTGEKFISEHWCNVEIARLHEEAASTEAKAA